MSTKLAMLQDQLTHAIFYVLLLLSGIFLTLLLHLIHQDMLHNPCIHETFFKGALACVPVLSFFFSSFAVIHFILLSFLVVVSTLWIVNSWSTGAPHIGLVHHHISSAYINICRRRIQSPSLGGMGSM